MVGHAERAPKRRRVENEFQHPDGDIRGAFELHNLLRFKQSTDLEVKAGIDRFRKFLVDISATKEPEEKAVLLKVLKHYCDDQSASSKNDSDLPDLLSTWSFAAQNNADSITSAVPATLAQFFRTINNEIDFRDFGLSLCHSLLKTDQVRLLDRGLSAPKHKDFMISPCLRLVTEITSFDAGAVAANVFSRRDVLLRRLDVLLEPLPRQKEESDRRRPTLRRNAQRLLLVLIRYLDGEALAELVTQGKALDACIRSLPTDGGDIVRDILKAIRVRLLGSGLSKGNKTRFLSAAILQLFAQLYDFEAEEADETAGATPVRQEAHDFLVHVCTTNSGALLTQTGWYPSNFDSGRLSEEDDDSGIDLGLDSPYYSDDYNASVPVKNTNLSIFLQKLKPASDVLQAELMARIFAAAPELVADFFCKQPKALGSPPEDNSWLGEFGFLYSIVDLPIPSNLGHTDGVPDSPPPLSIVVENILPRALDRTSTTSFLKKGEDLTTLSASRLLTIALQKLVTIIKIFRARRPHQLWEQASTRLLDLVAVRAPFYNELVTVLQTTPKENVAVRGALLECMAAYKNVLPNATLSASFDVSSILLDVLRQLSDNEVDDDARQALIKQKASIVEIASLSRSTKWWHKSASESLCPAVALLVNIATQGGSTDDDKAVSDVLRSLFQEKGILHPAGEGWPALKESLRSTLSEDQAQDQTLLSSLENCMTRTAKQPVKYVDYLEDIRNQGHGSKPVSLLAGAIVEQWSHLLKHDDINALVDFVSKFFTLLAAGGEDDTVLEALRSRMLDEVKEHKKHRKVLKKAFEAQVRDPLKLIHDESPPPSPTVDALQTSEQKALDTAALFPPPPPLPTGHKPFPPTYSLEADLSTSPTTSRLAQQLRLLSSPTPELRLTALHSLTTLLPTVPTSPYPEAPLIHLLVGELLETARQHAINHPTTPHLPNLITTLSTHLLSILTLPSHPTYSKASRFLLLAPNWLPLPRLLPYLTTQFLLTEPDVDDPANPDYETLLYLSIIEAGLLTQEDAELCRRANLWERLGALYLRPGCRREVRMGVLRCLWNAAGTERGADTLVTRAGVRGWLDVVEGRERGEVREMVRALRGRVEERCDAAYIERWEGRRVREGDDGRGEEKDGHGLGLGIM